MLTEKIDIECNIILHRSQDISFTKIGIYDVCAELICIQIRLSRCLVKEGVNIDFILKIRHPYAKKLNLLIQ